MRNFTYIVQCPPNLYVNPCPGIRVQNYYPTIDTKCGGTNNIETQDYVYDQNTCIHTWKVVWTWRCNDCGEDFGCSLIPLECCVPNEDGDECLFYRVIGTAKAIPSTPCNGSNNQYKVIYNFTDTCGNTNMCAFLYTGALC